MRADGRRPSPPAPMATAAMAAPEGAMMRAEAPMMAAAEESKVAQPPDTPIDVRSDFNPLALFAPAVRTDAAGQATVAYTVPDNLTQYRVMVVALSLIHISEPTRPY